MKLYITFIFLLIVASPTLWAQQQFITRGKIEYERKTNQHAFMDENSIWDNMAQKSLSKFVTYYYDLTFNETHTFYKQGREADTKQGKFWNVFSSENIILTNLDSNTIITQRTIYGDLLLVTDSVRNIEWKITPEIRKIAGFDCRKAVGKIMDSLVVVAFYTDEIIPGGGPESFSGLPGMILGLAIPRLHTTWYATKLQLPEVTDKDFIAPKKGKKLTGSEYRTTVKKMLSDRGDSDNDKKMEWQLLL